MTRNYGWRRQAKDTRDIKFGMGYVPAVKPASFLSRYDLKGNLPACWDQQDTSDCIGHGVSATIWNAEVRAGQAPVMPSRLFNYWNFRNLEGDTGVDEGGQIRDGIKACNVFGIAPEILWPWTPDKTLFEKPTPDVYAAAIKDKIHLYATVDLTDIDHIKLALSHNLVIVFGFDVPKYFESDAMAESGVINLSNFNRIIGGHCNVIIGTDDNAGPYGLADIRNSYGTEWGPFKGNYKMGYEVLTSQYCSDAWVVRI